jgi:iron complex outermembrane receptor protein
MRKFVYGVIGLLSLSSTIVWAKDEPLDLGTIDVVSTSPLENSEIAANKLPTRIQKVDSEQLQKAQSLSLSEYMNRYLSGVSVNEAQNNPLQPDIYYRGFVASPLLGMPQGLSTYVNGVRFNEPFGDTVNWDLISENAIDTMSLHSGSNPVYGLNSLGGAIAVKTKTGFSAPEHQIEVYGGSWDRHSEDLTSGWNDGTWGYFVNLNHFEEGGWRNYSPSKAERALGTLSWRGDKGSLDLTLAANYNNMNGNGASPIQLSQQDYDAVFTHPDTTTTSMFFSQLQGSYDLTDKIELSGNAYFRQNRMKTFNGDNSDYDDCEDEDHDGLLCEDGDEVVIDTFGNPVEATDAVEGATNNTSQTNMRSRGGTIQAVFANDLFKHKNNLTTGVNYDYAETNFSSDTELGSLTDTRGTTRSGIFVDEFKVRLRTNTSTVGVYLTDSFSITDKLTATVAGRYNYIHVNMFDQYINDPTKNLNGSHTFERLNPSAGLSYQALDNLNWYANYSESTRAPSPMELSCADPEAPCKLPNSFVADPPLEQVVAKTWETGIRGDLNKLIEDDVKWNLGFFHTINHNDIIFRRDAASNIISQGYFDNVGKTRRYGIEAGTVANFDKVFSSIDNWHLSANYTYLNARFLSPFDTVNPLNTSEAIVVNSGSKIPGIPEHIFKAAVGVDLWQKFYVGVNGEYSGDRYLRGDEANRDNKLTGYWLFNATAEYKITKNFTVFGKLDNIFDKRYYSFGAYGQADEVLGNSYDNPRFVSPGMPRAGWIGVRLSL